MARHRVLIVEDEQDIAGLIKPTLERAGETEALIVGSGDAALKAVTERVPDLIILDLNLPVVGGLEVCRILRSRADVPHVPNILLSARTSEDDRVSGLVQGADDYVTKPFSLRERPWTCTSDVCAASSGRRATKSRRSSASATGLSIDRRSERSRL
jgi:two-component system, OmpR family, phosphate regulon response regulator PhoB